VEQIIVKKTTYITELMLLVLFCFLMSGISGCPEKGTLGGPCNDNGTCDDGLVCNDYNICVTDDDGNGDTGFDFTLEQGTYWEYYWTYEKTSYAQGSGSSTSVDSGNFRITLGPPISIEGTLAYSVTVTGDADDPNYDFTPRWEYIAVDEGQILGSENGVDLEVIFDAPKGQWNGGGFFTTFSDSTTLSATTDHIDNEFIETSAVSVNRFANQTQCETVAGITICPNDDSYTVSEKEYYKGGIGPIGYFCMLRYSSSGGNFYTSFSYERHLGLVDTSLTAEDGFEPTLPPWIKKADMPTPRSSHSAVVVDGKIWVMGGSATDDSGWNYYSVIEIYDPDTDSWSNGSNMPEPWYGHSSIVYNRGIYVIGGSNPDGAIKAVRKYDIDEQIWYTLSEMPTSWTAHTSVLMGDVILVFGDNKYGALLYNIPTDTWYSITDMPLKRYDQTAGFSDGYAYVFGGLYTSGAEFKSTCLRFDPNESYGSDDAWTFQAPMPTGRRGMTSAAVDGKIYVIGGFNYDGEHRTVEMYNPSLDVWTSKYSMPTAREGACSAVVSGKIYVIGGQKHNDFLATIEEYDPAMDD
jgi:N-acetylneuraminic acid mutarotase